MKKKVKLVLIITSSALLLLIILSVFLVIPMVASHILRHPKHLDTYMDPSDLGMTYENVTITTEDDVDLKAWWIEPKDMMNPNSNITLIVLHGYSKNKAWMLDHYGDEFYDSGYRMLFLDERGRGESPDTDPGVMYGWDEIKDLRAAVDFVKGDPDVNDSQVVIFAESAGAACLLFYTAQYNDVAAIIADSSWADGFEMIKRGFPARSPFPWFIIGQITIKLVERQYGIKFVNISPEIYVGSITVPTYIIHGGEDPEIPPEDAQTIFDIIPLGTTKNLTIYPGAVHVESYLETNYFSNIDTFIADNI